MTSVIKRYHTAFIDVIKRHFYGVSQSNSIVCYITVQYIQMKSITYNHLLLIKYYIVQVQYMYHQV